MRIIILHGQNSTKSYERLTRFIDEAKSRGWEIIYDDVSATPSLFGKQRITIVRDIKLIPRNIERIQGTLIIYSDSDLPLSFLKKFKDAKIEKFDLPKIIWKFLEKPSVKLFHEVIKKEPVELVFHLLAKKLRRTKYINDMARIDYQAKTGKTDLLLSLDLFIAKHLE